MIGGEFEIDLSLQKDSFVPQLDTYYYASGRTALYQILKTFSGKRQKIWLPDWLCHTIINGVEKAGFEYVFYELDEHFYATIEALDQSGFRNGDVVLIVNYFGLLIQTEAAKKIKEVYPDSIVIEDDVQAFWEFTERENPYADYRYTSLRKSFPIPDGGLVYTKRFMSAAMEENTFSPIKFQAGVMKLNRGRGGIKDEDYLALFKQGDILIAENYESRMSDDSKLMYAGTNLQIAKRIRQSNAKTLLNGLAELGIKPIIEVSNDSVPLFIPIYLDNRDIVRHRMFQHEVYCPVHWPIEKKDLKRGAEMAKHELSLIVDQRYNENDMHQIISLIK